MRTLSLVFRTILLTGLLLAVGSPSYADTRDDDIQELREQIRQLAAKLDALERKQATQAAAPVTTLAGSATVVTATNNPATPQVTLDEKGLRVVSPDKSYALHLGALFQLDGRWFFKPHSVPGIDTFVARRARTVFDGTFEKIYSYKLVPEFGSGSSPTLLDAYVDAAFSDALQLRFGRFKAPVGLELLQTEGMGPFAERSLVTNLVPNRDLGLQVGGSLFGKAVNYTVGVYNGVADGANSSNADFDNDKDVIARVFAQPFDKLKDSILTGFGIGISGSLGREKTASALSSGYKTDGQQTFFRYRSSVLADGDTWRISPQAYYYHGSFEALSDRPLCRLQDRSERVLIVRRFGDEFAGNVSLGSRRELVP